MTTTAPIKLAIIASAPSPYRVHQHLRIARELGDEVELYSVFLSEHNWQPWSTPLPEEIRPVVLAKGRAALGRKRGLNRLREWGRGGDAIAWLRQHDVDVVITAGYHDLGLLRIIAWCKKAGKPNYLFGDSNIHGDRARGWRRWFKQRLVGWAVNNVSGLLPCGEYGRQYFEQYGGRGKPTFYMPHEPDYGKIFGVTAPQRSAVQEKFQLRDDRRYVLYSGRLAPVKRVDTLIDAFGRIAAERPGWDLLVIGGGPLEAELKARVPQRLRARVAWTGFINDAAELSALYTCGDVFVLPSSYEPWAVVVCEGAAAGLPIVASTVVGAAGELCRDGVNGRLFTPGDVAGLSQALLDVTASDERLEALSRGSLQILDDWRRRGDPVQGVRLLLADAGLAPAPPPVEPDPPTPTSRWDTRLSKASS